MYRAIIVILSHCNNIDELSLTAICIVHIQTLYKRLNKVYCRHTNELDYKIIHQAVYIYIYIYIYICIFSQRGNRIN